MRQNFQVDLKAIIQLLSNNLYSGPQVFIRELIQNGVDAIRARQHDEPQSQGRIEMELLRTAKGERLLVVEDSGAGLTEEEVHRFLATIGSSSKREQVMERRDDYIGQFGIGLLSCFIVTDEIVLLSQSIREGADAVEWRGHSDGSYSTRCLDRKLSPGTKIYLRVMPGKEEFFEFESLLAQARNYAGLLPLAISLQEGERREEITLLPPWSTGFANEQERNAHFAQFGVDLFQADFFDFIPLNDAALGLKGVAYVLPYAPNPTGRKTHRLYLKSMLISEEAEFVAPEWAFFVKCVLDTQNLTPTASRESVCEDAALQTLQDSVARQLKEYIHRLAKYDEARLHRFLALHSRSLKQLGTFDDESLLLFIDHLPFETNFGVKSLAECRRLYEDIHYVSSVDEFRQISEIAAAQGRQVINAGYVYETELLERYASLEPALAPQLLSLTSFANTLQEIELDERERFFRLLDLADLILQRFGVKASIRHYLPTSLPVLYIVSQQTLFRLSAEEAQKNADPGWGEILGDILAQTPDERPELCLNAANPLIQRLAQQAAFSGKEGLKEVIEVLYVQALLLGRRSLRTEELAALNNGILHLATARFAAL